MERKKPNRTGSSDEECRALVLRKRILISAPGGRIRHRRNEDSFLEKQRQQSGKMAEVPGSTPKLVFLATVNR